MHRRSAGAMAGQADRYSRRRAAAHRCWTSAGAMPPAKPQTQSTVDVLQPSTVPTHRNPALARGVSAEDHVTGLVTECNSRRSVRWPILGLARLGGNTASQEGTTCSFQPSAQDVDSARAALVLVMAGVAIFWRLVLRVLLAVIILAAVVGAVVLLQVMHG